MAKSKFEYVKAFEQSDSLLPGCWIVVRIDGKAFTKFCEAHAFEKPNDEAALQLMDAAALEVVTAFPEIRIAYGESDEYSFVFGKDCQLYSRRASKLTCLLVSLFSASYVRQWPQHFPKKPLQLTPAFDARAVCYPSDKALRDYLSWRQVRSGFLRPQSPCILPGLAPAHTPGRKHSTRPVR
jgi:tRNA(His) guanylyltransferase